MAPGEQTQKAGKQIWESYLSIMGGHTQEMVVRRLLTHALFNGLASQLNWAGKGHKRAFKDTALHDIMFAALQKQIPGSTHIGFADAVKKWLKYAPDRGGGVPRRLDTGTCRHLGDGLAASGCADAGVHLGSNTAVGAYNTSITAPTRNESLAFINRHLQGQYQNPELSILPFT
ncbi:uncharacterized protein LOC143486116 [Brachyhypopomus gauderio]|uniref:uncharacterized protein LOC143486116 n=1 Tax=Brachyhypopomus gauderio TaxID=698409 RepID=UPI0040411C2E